jgi:hypothetical protein
MQHDDNSSYTNTQDYFLFFRQSDAWPHLVSLLSQKHGYKSRYPARDLRQQRGEVGYSTIVGASTRLRVTPSAFQAAELD